VGTDGSAYYVRAAMCIGKVPSNYDITALAVLRYVATGSKATTTLPSSTDWSDSVNNSTCYDLDTTGVTMTPLIASDPPTTVVSSTVMVRSSLCNLQRISSYPLCAR
jgi:hypothetical protein